MNDMAMTSPAATALMTVAMMVAMMLPSVAPSLWRYHRDLRAMRLARVGKRTTLFAMGYVSVWSGIALALFAMSTVISPLGPWATGAIVLCAGALQRSRWKARQLVRCRVVCMAAVVPSNAATLWQGGCRFGVACALSCAAPMAVLFVAGLMDAPMMLVITAAITAERVTPAGERIARLTGSLALTAGLIMCVLAILGF
jgi:predicted metal-binding membrane protein